MVLNATNIYLRITLWVSRVNLIIQCSRFSGIMLHKFVKIIISLSDIKMGSCGVQCHFQQYFSYIVMNIIIGGGNRSTKRKPLTNFNT
jgi:hypothetical protein